MDWSAILYAVSNACSWGTGISGETPLPSQFALVIGLIARPLHGYSVGYRRDDNSRQCRPAGCDNNQREQQELALLQDSAIGKPQPPGDREGDSKECNDLMTPDQIR
jgi:hypothetical protein